MVRQSFDRRHRANAAPAANLSCTRAIVPLRRHDERASRQRWLTAVADPFVKTPGSLAEALFYVSDRTMRWGGSGAV